MGRYQRSIVGVLATLAGLGVLLAILLPLRPHVSIAIPALLFVLPALLGVVLGGFVPGVVGALGGFLCYDYFFLPPYNTLTVRSPQNWVALVVYVVVVLVVAQVVAQLQRAREDALRRTEETARLYELVAGTHRRPQPVAAADAHRRHGAGRLHSTLDRADPSRRWPRCTGTRVRCCGSPPRRESAWPRAKSPA